jgi:hypothetical protein
MLFGWSILGKMQYHIIIIENQNEYRNRTYTETEFVYSLGKCRILDDLVFKDHEPYLLFYNGYWTCM